MNSADFEPHRTCSIYIAILQILDYIFFLDIQSGNSVAPGCIQSESAISERILSIVTHGLEYYRYTFHHFCHILVREDDRFNARSSELDERLIVQVG
jgi:hypothetical protein